MSFGSHGDLPVPPKDELMIYDPPYLVKTT